MSFSWSKWAWMVWAFVSFFLIPCYLWVGLVNSERCCVDKCFIFWHKLIFFLSLLRSVKCSNACMIFWKVFLSDFFFLFKMKSNLNVIDCSRSPAKHSSQCHCVGKDPVILYLTDWILYYGLEGKLFNLWLTKAKTVDHSVRFSCIRLMPIKSCSGPCNGLHVKPNYCRCDNRQTGIFFL